MPRRARSSVRRAPTTARNFRPAANKSRSLPTAREITKSGSRMPKVKPAAVNRLTGRRRQPAFLPGRKIHRLRRANRRRQQYLHRSRERRRTASFDRNGQNQRLACVECRRQMDFLSLQPHGQPSNLENARWRRRSDSNYTARRI